MRFLILALFLIPSLSQAFPTSCGAKLPGTDLELMFQFFGAERGQAEPVEISVGKPFAFKGTTVNIVKRKEKLGFWHYNEIHQDGSRFKLSVTIKGLSVASPYLLSADLPEIGLKVKNLEVDCMSYM